MIWIANGELTRRLNAMSARHVMVTADSCYSGTLVRTASSKLATGAERDEWLRRVAEKRSRTAIVSGGLEPVMDAGGGNHSVFAAALIESLTSNDKPLEGQELFRRVSRPVVVNSNQTPQYSPISAAPDTKAASSSFCRRPQLDPGPFRVARRPPGIRRRQRGRAGSGVLVGDQGRGGSGVFPGLSRRVSERHVRRPGQAADCQAEPGDRRRVWWKRLRRAEGCGRNLPEGTGREFPGLRRMPRNGRPAGR